jgi:hypothetical protein
VNAILCIGVVSERIARHRVQQLPVCGVDGLQTLGRPREEIGDEFAIRTHAVIRPILQLSTHLAK